MNIEVDFDVYQALTLLRKNEMDSYGDVIRRLLRLSEIESAAGDARDQVVSSNKNILANLLRNTPDTMEGAWIGNVHFPNGTRFRATYKGRTFRAEIRENLWVGEDGKLRKSPSEAASAISGTSVNGWRFWYGQRPGDDDWRRLDEFRG
jgi:predicted CopG family antitoxin